MSQFKQINLKVVKRIPIAWDKEDKKKPTQYKRVIEEYGFNLYEISYWRGEISFKEGDEDTPDQHERKCYLYLRGNTKAIQLNMSREEFEKQLEAAVGDDLEAKIHLAGNVTGENESN